MKPFTVGRLIPAAGCLLVVLACQGPGEFQYAATFARLPGDTLLVEAIDSYISFAPSGDYVGEWRIDSSDLVAREHAVFGSLAMGRNCHWGSTWVPTMGSCSPAAPGSPLAGRQ